MADKTLPPGAWPFKRLSRVEWDQLGDLQAVVEDAAVTTARRLLAEISAVRKSTPRASATVLKLVPRTAAGRSN